MNPGRAALALMRRIEAASNFDPAVHRVRRAASTLLPDGSLGRLLRGNWLGHAVHPVLTDFVEGAWMAATFLDWFGPKAYRGAGQRLLGFGLLVAAPTYLSGLVEWLDEDRPEQRRVGLIHLTGISVTTTLYLTSYLLRRGQQQEKGRIVGLAAGLVALTDGYVAGHMSHVRLVATGGITEASESGY